MTMHTPRGASLAGLTWLLVCVIAPAMAGPDDRPMPLRAKPLRADSIGVKPWETSSSSPLGGFRMGGSDRRTFALSPDGKLLASEDAGGWQLELWSLSTGKSLGRFGRINDPVALAFSPDGRTLATAGWGRHGCAVELWDVARHRRIRSLDEDVNWTPFGAVAFSPDGKLLALAASGDRRSEKKTMIHLWEVSSGDEVRQLPGPTPSDEERGPVSPILDCLCFSPDGKALAVVSDHRVLLWEVATGKERCLLGVLPPVYGHGDDLSDELAAAAFSPDGRTLAVGCPDGVVRLWDVLAGKELAPLVGHRAAVRAVCFAADGKTLLSFGRDNQLLTWSARDARREYPRRQQLAAPELGTLWNDLRGEDRVRLQEAIRSLAEAPASALPFLRRRLKPVPVINGVWITQQVEDLGNADFNERKRAARELRKLGDLAIPALREASEHRYNEILRGMLERLESEYPTPEQVQALHALEAVERMGGDEARRLLAELARGASQALLTQQARAALERLKKPAAAGGGEGKLDGLWVDLAGADAGRGFQAMRILWAREKEAVPFLGQKLRARAARESRDDPRRIAQLIADLDSSEFAVRDKASKELAELGRSAEAPLREALRGSLSPEAARRIKDLLSSAAQRAITAEHLQMERALEVLEHAGTESARHLLKDLSRQGRNDRLKKAAAESLRRLGG